MNIEEYRAMKAESERAKTDAQTEQVPTEPVLQGSPETEQTKPTPTEGSTETETQTQQPTTIEIDGKQVPIDELKNGYLRQSDYTKKTQEVKRKERQAEEALKLIEQLQSNPQVAQQLSQQFDLPNLDPVQAKQNDLEAKYYDLLIEKEINELQATYGTDFDVQEVLRTASEHQLNDLDTAYHVLQSRKGGGRQTEVDIEQIKSQLREELMKELKSQVDANVDTSSVIQSGGDTSPVRDTTPQLSAGELKVARMMGFKNPEEYAKWRDIKKKK